MEFNLSSHNPGVVILALGSSIDVIGENKVYVVVDVDMAREVEEGLEEKVCKGTQLGS